MTSNECAIWNPLQFVGVFVSIHFHFKIIVFKIEQVRVGSRGSVRVNFAVCSLYMVIIVYVSFTLIVTMSV